MKYGINNCPTRYELCKFVSDISLVCNIAELYEIVLQSVREKSASTKEK